MTSPSRSRSSKPPAQQGDPVRTKPPHPDRRRGIATVGVGFAALCLLVSAPAAQAEAIITLTNPAQSARNQIAEGDQSAGPVVDSSVTGIVRRAYANPGGVGAFISADGIGQHAPFRGIESTLSFTIDLVSTDPAIELVDVGLSAHLEGSLRRTDRGSARVYADLRLDGKTPSGNPNNPPVGIADADGFDAHALSGGVTAVDVDETLSVFLQDAMIDRQLTLDLKLDVRAGAGSQTLGGGTAVADFENSLLFDPEQMFTFSIDGSPTTAVTANSEIMGLVDNQLPDLIDSHVVPTPGAATVGLVAFGMLAMTRRRPCRAREEPCAA